MRGGGRGCIGVDQVAFADKLSGVELSSVEKMQRYKGQSEIGDEWFRRHV